MPPLSPAWSAPASHRSRPFAFAIDRGAGDRPSFAGSHPSAQLVVARDGRAKRWCEGRWTIADGDPIDTIASFVDAGEAEASLLPSWLDGETLPRTVGYLAYELGSWADGRGAGRPAVHEIRESIGTPLAVLSTYDEIDAWDPRSGRGARVRFAAGAAAPPPPLEAPLAGRWTPTSRERYERGFARIQDAIGDGEIYQANLTRRAVFDSDDDPFATWESLRGVQPVPWGAFLDFGGFALLSNSPECFLVRDGDAVVTRPIKGTRPRSGDPARDAALRLALRADSKEMAEHLMIVDLERNDLGRVARTGSVVVPRLAGVESFATVHHLESEVRAVLRDGTGLAPLLRATFPGGSITGAPKIRAMEILAEVEDGERGAYTGAIGFFQGATRLELSIAIRTAVAAGGRLLCQAGGGIVADSVAAREWEETDVKLAAMRAALASRGRDRKPREGAVA